MKPSMRVLAVLLCLMMLLSFAACGNDARPSDDASGTESTVEPDTQPTNDVSSEATGESSLQTGEETEGTGGVTTKNTTAKNTTAKNTTATTKKQSGGVATRPTDLASDINKNKYADIGLNIKEFNVKNKTLKMFVGPERTNSDFLSTTDLPGVWELMKAYYDVDIELISCGDYNDWYTKLAMLSLSDNSPDIASPLSESYPYDIVKGNILPLDDMFDWNDKIWDKTRDMMANQYSWNGKHYHAIYEDGQYMTPLYYNPKIFKQNGVKTPRECIEDGTWSWQTMLDMAIELTQDTDNDGKTDLWGTGGMFFYTMQAACGKSLVTIEGKKVTNNITDPIFAQVAQFIYDLGPNGKYKVCTAFSHDNADLFVSGQAAMDTGTHYRVWTTYKDMWKAGTVDVVPFPPMEAGGTYYKSGVPATLVIFKKAKNVEAAKAYIWVSAYLQSEEARGKMETYGKKMGVDMRYASTLFIDIPGLTDTQYEHILESIWDRDNKYKMKSNPTNWLGWINNGWDNGLQYAHEKQWSAIVNVYKNQFNASIEETVEALNLLTG